MKEEEGGAFHSEFEEREEDGEGEQDEDEREQEAREDQAALAELAAQDGKKKKAKKKKPLPTIRIHLANCKYEVLRIVQRKFGWREVGDEEDWEIHWTDTSVGIERIMKLNKTQKINHFSGMLELCRKRSMARNLQKIQKVFPEHYDFFPRTFILPGDMQELVKDVKERGKKQVYILKPDAGCQGRGIRLIQGGKEDVLAKTLTEMNTVNIVAQHYLPRPFLINGFKFDLRIYALVLSCDPLRVFVFREGLARICTEQYTKPKASNLAVSYMHLTNYAVNKHNEHFVANQGSPDDAENASKLGLEQLAAYITEQGHDWPKCWAAIHQLIVKSLISVQPVLKNNYRSAVSIDNDGFSCFEVLGYDIMLDEELRPWLIECNHSSSFNIDSPLDLAIKEALITDTLELVRVDPKLILKAQRLEKRSAAERLLAPLHKKKAEAAAAAAAAAGGVGAAAAVATEREAEMAGGSDGEAAASRPRTLEELEAWRADIIRKREKYEETHCGGYTRIFPSDDPKLQALYEELLRGSSEIYGSAFASRPRKAMDAMSDDRRRKEENESESVKAERARARAHRDRLAQQAVERRRLKAEFQASQAQLAMQQAQQMVYPGVAGNPDWLGFAVPGTPPMGPPPSVHVTPLQQGSGRGGSGGCFGAGGYCYEDGGGGGEYYPGGQQELYGEDSRACSAGQEGYNFYTSPSSSPYHQQYNYPLAGVGGAGTRPQSAHSGGAASGSGQQRSGSDSDALAYFYRYGGGGDGAAAAAAAGRPRPPGSGSNAGPGVGSIDVWGSPYSSPYKLDSANMTYNNHNTNGASAPASFRACRPVSACSALSWGRVAGGDRRASGPHQAPPPPAADTLLLAQPPSTPDSQPESHHHHQPARRAADHTSSPASPLAPAQPGGRPLPSTSLPQHHQQSFGAAAGAAVAAAHADASFLYHGRLPQPLVPQADGVPSGPGLHRVAGAAGGAGPSSCSSATGASEQLQQPLAGPSAAGGASQQPAGGSIGGRQGGGTGAAGTPGGGGGGTVSLLGKLQPAGERDGEAAVGFTQHGGGGGTGGGVWPAADAAGGGSAAAAARGAAAWGAAAGAAAAAGPAAATAPRKSSGGATGSSPAAAAAGEAAVTAASGGGVAAAAVLRFPPTSPGLASPLHWLDSSHGWDWSCGYLSGAPLTGTPLAGRGGAGDSRAQSAGQPQRRASAALLRGGGSAAPLAISSLSASARSFTSAQRGGGPTPTAAPGSPMRPASALQQQQQQQQSSAPGATLLSSAATMFKDANVASAAAAFAAFYQPKASFLNSHASALSGSSTAATHNSYVLDGEGGSSGATVGPTAVAIQRGLSFSRKGPDSGGKGGAAAGGAAVAAAPLTGHAIAARALYGGGGGGGAGGTSVGSTGAAQGVGVGMGGGVKAASGASTRSPSGTAAAATASAPGSPQFFSHLRPESARPAAPDSPAAPSSPAGSPAVKARPYNAGGTGGQLYPYLVLDSSERKSLMLTGALPDYGSSMLRAPVLAVTGQGARRKLHQG